jgi:dihydroorotase-like cyclic amidohydrolase
MKKVKFLLVVLLFTMSSFLFAQDKKEKAPTVLITNIKVWDGTSNTTIDADVLIEGDKFKEITAKIKAPKDATVIDGQGGTLIPGLIDMHQHLNLWGGNHRRYL